VIGVETLNVPVQKDGALDCGRTRWSENNVGDLPYVFALRVFFNAEINGRLYGCDKCHIGQSSAQHSRKVVNSRTRNRQLVHRYPVQASLSKFLTYHVLRPTQPPNRRWDGK